MGVLGKKRKSPTSREQRDTVWDYLREKFKIAPTMYSNKQELLAAVRKAMGLEKFQRAQRRQKSLLGLIKKSDFWIESVDEGRGIPARSGGWTQVEKDTLREMSRNYKGKELVTRYNALVKVYEGEGKLREKRYWQIVKMKGRLK